MDTSKIKNIIILILLAVNVFLAAALIGDRAQTNAVKTAAWESAIEAVERAGISVSEDISSDLATPSVYTLRRDMDSELEWLGRLLGSVTAADLGGNIWFYSSESGQASVRGAGECDILFSTDTFSTGRSAAKSAEKVMKKLGLEPDGANADVISSRDGSTVTLGCLWQGCPVYNAELSFTFSEDYLVMISGTRIFDRQVQVSGEGVLDELSVMLRFVEAVSEQGYVCSSLSALDSGYIFSVAVSGEGTLNPVWRFTTDTGELYINAVTGRVETLR